MSVAETPRHHCVPSARSPVSKTAGEAHGTVAPASVLLNTSRAVAANLGSHTCGTEARQMLDAALRQVRRLTHPSDDAVAHVFADTRADLLAGHLEKATERVLEAKEIGIAIPALLAILACFWRVQGNAAYAQDLIEQALRHELLSNTWRIILGWERWMMRAHARLQTFQSSGDKKRALALAHKILRRDQDATAARETVAQYGGAETLGALRQVGAISPEKLPHPMSVVQTADDTVYFGSYTLAGAQAALYGLGPHDNAPRQLSAGRLYSGLVADPCGDGLLGLCGGENGDMKVRALHRLTLSGQITEVKDLSGIDDLANGIPYGLGRADNNTLAFLDLLRGRLYTASAADLTPQMLCDVNRQSRPLYYGVIGNQVYVTFANHGQLLVVDVASGEARTVRRAYLKGVCSITRAPGFDGFFMVKRAYVKSGNTTLIYDTLIHADNEYKIIGTMRLGCCLSCGVMPFRLDGKDCLCALSYDFGAAVYRLNA